MLKIYDCDFGFVLAGVDYEFADVNEVRVTDPRRVRITRGANAKNKDGLVYIEGSREAQTMEIDVMDMTPEMFTVLVDAQKAKTRFEDVYAISRESGSGKSAKRAILSQAPQQLTINESPDSLSVTLTFETFDLTEGRK